MQSLKLTPSCYHLGGLLFCLPPSYSLTSVIKNIIWEGDRAKSATSKQHVLVQQTQGLYVGNLPQLRSRGIYGLISSFSAYEHRFDYFTDWVLLVTILINPKCWSISLFCHGYREQQSVGVQRSYLRVHYNSNYLR